MICDICGKNSATVHLTEIVDGQMTELHICEVCAKEKSIEMEQQFGLSDLLAGLADFGKHLEGQEAVQLQCPVCKLTYNDFKKIGRLGCSSCYDAFSSYLLPLLKRIHGSTTHTGKVPANFVKVDRVEKKAAVPIVKAGEKKPEVSATKTGGRPDLAELKNKLQEAIKNENFEEAAALRDTIRELEKAQANPPEADGVGKSPEKKKKKLQ